jgi:hypothetical protein
MGGALKWVGSSAIILAFAVAGGLAYQRGKANEAVTEASEQARTLLRQLAKCVVDQSVANGGKLPPSADPIPARLEDLKRGGAFAEVALSAPYNCAKVDDSSPLRVQMVWIRDEREGHTSRFFARTDADGDGRPEAHFEAPVSCKKQGGSSGCLASHHVFAVREDGEREPPPATPMTGIIRGYRGVPPDKDDAMSLDRVESGSRSVPESVPAEEPTKLPELGVKLDGQAAPYSFVVQGAQDLAAKMDSKLTLVGFEVNGLRGQNVDPVQDQRVTLLFGEVDSSERLPPGALVVAVSYTEKGLVSESRKAKGALMALPLPLCAAPKAMEAVNGISGSLVRPPGQDRVLWQVQLKGKRQPVFLDAERCSIVRK